MPLELISHPDRQPDLPPRRSVRWGLVVRQNHERLDHPDVGSARGEGAVEDDLRVGEERRVQVPPGELRGGSEEGGEQDGGGAAEVLHRVH